MENKKLLSLPENAFQVNISYQEMREYFPEQLKAFHENYEACVEFSKEEGEPDPGVTHPSKCRYYLQHGSPFGDSNANFLPDYPGWELHAVDDAAVSNLAGGGTDMVWEYGEWEA